MANLDLYTTIRLGPDPNRMGHNIRGCFDPMHHACFAPFPAYLIAVLATTNGRFTAVITGSQMDKSCLNFHPACKLINRPPPDFELEFPNGILPGAKLTLRPSLYWQRYCTTFEQWALAELCGVGQGNSAGWPSRGTSVPHNKF